MCACVSTTPHMIFLIKQIFFVLEIFHVKNKEITWRSYMQYFPKNLRGFLRRGHM